jgi:carbon storage regulator
MPLNITRRATEQIRIGDELLLTLVSTTSSQTCIVTIGDDAITLRCGESHHIDERTSVRLIQIERGEARFSVKAPREVGVWREEIYQRIQAEKAGEK